jgi:hypothetical protein
MRPVSGLAILSLNPSLQMKLTDDYAAGNPDAHKSQVDERYRLISPTIFELSRSFKHTGAALECFKRGDRALGKFLGRATLVR